MQRTHLPWKNLCGNQYWVSFTQYLMSGFQQQQELQGVLKRQEDAVWRDRTSIRIRFRHARVLELSEQEFRKTMIIMLRARMEKVGKDMLEQMDDVNRGMEILRTNQKEMLEIETP